MPRPRIAVARCTIGFRVNRGGRNVTESGMHTKLLLYSTGALVPPGVKTFIDDEC